mmetsp:Transcript_35534/g.98290  ORF Transcript_35534/g.98290 Transcript_35534/m.98290 type:complete len:317 (-) Transcript_35534:575-1525(-)
MMSLPVLGCFLRHVSSVCSTGLEKRGPIRTYSRSRSRSSRRTSESGDLCASSKTLTIMDALPASDMPTHELGEMSFTKGNSESSARRAAIAVLPEPDSPSSSIDSKLVCSDRCICAINSPAEAISSRCARPYSIMPPRTQMVRSSCETPNAGFTSLSAKSKSAIISSMSSSLPVFMPPDSAVTCLWKAKLDADLTRPSISAPEKFLVDAASVGSETSLPRQRASRIGIVWMLRICSRPCSSGSEISICTSSRPGRSRASSIMSFRLVMPMTRILLSELTPSILERSWLTTVSPTPVPSRDEPRALHTESISSKMMM